MRSYFEIGRALQVCALTCIVFASGAFAQTAEQIELFKKLSPEQIEQIQKLSPEQRAAFIKEFEAGQQSEKPLSQPQVVTPAPLRQQAAGASAIEHSYAGRTSAAHLRQPQAEKSVAQQLKQFGYDLFAGTPSTFAPATDIPVPPNYLIGPGDTIQIQLFGKENAEYSLVVTREGLLNFPELGAIPVAGIQFDSLRKNLEQRVAEQMIGTKASITMGALRSIRVFVLGDVTRPGSYTVSALSTMTNALFVSGGIQPIGSLRNVQLKRNGRVVTRLDLYDLLLRGDTSDDARLQPGDVIFVPPIGQTAGIAGEVRRPAIYELRGEKTVRQLIEIAGGLLPTAVPQLSQLERLDTQGNLTLIDLDLDVGRQPLADVSAKKPNGGMGMPPYNKGADTALNDGDMLRIYSNLDRMEGIVLLAGHVKRPGGVAWRDDMHLTDLLPAPDHLLPQADLDYVVIRREGRPLAKVSVFSVRLGEAWANPGTDANPLLERRDQIFIFPLASASVIPVGRQPLAAGLSSSSVIPAQAGIQFSPGIRQSLLQPVLDELKTQAGSTEPTRIVSITGLIREPGDYPLEPGMRITDLIRASGRLGEEAYTLTAEITRYEVAQGEKREIAHIPVDLAAVIQGDSAANLPLQPHDNLHIKRVPQWSEQLLVEVRGEVRFPGTYPIKRGERLSALLQRAGGLSDQAFPEGAVFTREELRLKEQERIDTLAKQLEQDISAASLQRAQEDTKQAEALAAARSLLPQLRQAKAAGRLVIDLPELVRKGSESQYDVVLKGGDTLVIPPQTQEVTVIGEVQYPTSHLADTSLDVGDYVERSGGYTFKADDDRAYVVRANGQVEPASSGWWIFRLNTADVKPGDTIVVPLDVERMRPLTFWTSITQIAYQLAVIAAVLNNVGAI